MQQYIQAAMKLARYDKLSTGEWFGALPRFHAVFACGETEEACRQALQADLEGAIDAALRANRPLPHFDGVFTPELADVQ